jgi:HEAT repeat protein
VEPLMQMEPTVSREQYASESSWILTIERAYQEAGRPLPFDLEPAYDHEDEFLLKLQPLQALSEINHKNARAIDFLMPYLVGPDSRWRRLAAGCLGRVNHPKILTRIACALTHESLEVRGWAVYALGKTRKKGAVGYLGQSLKDPNTLIRLMAISALSEVRDKAALELIPPMLSDADEIVRFFTAQTLSILSKIQEESVGIGP